MLVCITGVSGVGKSSILTLLKDEYEVVIMDKLVHELYVANQPGYILVKNHFGSEYVNEVEVNRPKLGKLVFSNPQKLEELNVLLEPLITKSLEELKNRAKNDIILVEAAALLSNYDRYGKFFDKIILITANEARIRQNNKNKFFYIDNYEKCALKIDAKLKFDLIVSNNETVDKASDKISSYLRQFLGQK